MRRRHWLGRPRLGLAAFAGSLGRPCHIALSPWSRAPRGCCVRVPLSPLCFLPFAAFPARAPLPCGSPSALASLMVSSPLSLPFSARRAGAVAGVPALSLSLPLVGWCLLASARSLDPSHSSLAPLAAAASPAPAFLAVPPPRALLRGRACRLPFGSPPRPPPRLPAGQ